LQVKGYLKVAKMIISPTKGFASALSHPLKALSRGFLLKIHNYSRHDFLHVDIVESHDVLEMGGHRLRFGWIK
jgi:hypothetical protein